MAHRGRSAANRPGSSAGYRIRPIRWLVDHLWAVFLVSWILFTYASSFHLVQAAAVVSNTTTRTPLHFTDFDDGWLDFVSAVESNFTANGTMDIFRSGKAGNSSSNATDLPSNIPIRYDHPVPLRGISPEERNRTGPVHTGKFYANLLLDDGQNMPAYTGAYALSWVKGQLPSASYGFSMTHMMAHQIEFGNEGHNHHGKGSVKRDDGQALPNQPPSYAYGIPQRHDVILGAKELGPGSVLDLTEPTDMSVNVNVLPHKDAQSAAVQFPMVKGMAFFTALYNCSTPLIQSNHAILDAQYKLVDPDHGVQRWILTMNDNSVWVMYARAAPGTLPLHLTRELVHGHYVLHSAHPFTGSVQVTRHPGEKQTAEALAALDRAAGVYPTGIQMDGDVDMTGGTGWYRFSFNKSAAGAGSSLETEDDRLWRQHNPVLMVALPHHMQSMSNATRNAYVPLRMQTVTKGNAQVVHADEWIMTKSNLPTNLNLMPWDPKTEKPSNRTLSLYEQGVILAAARAEIKTSNVTAETGGPSMYWAGKSLVKHAHLLMAYDDAIRSNDYEKKRPFEASEDRRLYLDHFEKLKCAFDKYVANKQEVPLVYDAVWGGLVTSSVYGKNAEGKPDLLSDFGAGCYNDHHFHYGYFVYAASILHYLDADWFNNNTERTAFVDRLVADYASPSNNNSSSSLFPAWRSFDWYDGHSWAHGLFPSMDGKNEESTSEDVMSIYAAMQWGLATGNEALTRRSTLQLAVLKDALHFYVYLDDHGDIQTVQLERFLDNWIAGIMSENKIDHTTFFGILGEYVHGIHMIPLVPGLLFVRSPRFVLREWQYALGNGSLADSIDSNWKSILYANLAIADPKAAWAFFVRDDFQPQWLDGGMSRAYMQWVAAKLGANE